MCRERELRTARRRWLMQAGVLSTSAALPLWVPHAVAEPQSPLNALPRVALVIGNTRYPEAPLKNPGNDAKAIAGELQKVGFKVNLQLDTGRVQLAEAIQAFGADLARTKGVGLFYYAGHGAQLGWRNYLIPVDADIEKLEDMRTKTVELNLLLVGLTKAQNSMNVIILDACRDNPFGTKVPTENKGLSQFDAPPGSLLAYATSPGNTASDGQGANGLYTENLLREIKVPEAKVEDVFKRVRLNVRRSTNGAQIPWESTSLEEDFWFIPPKELKEFSDEEMETQFREQLAVWESVKNANDPEKLGAYLMRYPSGDYSELAHLKLDRLLAQRGERRIQVVTAEGNPYTKGTVRADTAYRLGDAFTYRRIDMDSGTAKGGYTTAISEITDTQVIYDRGLVTDLLGNTLRTADGRTFTDNQNVPVEFEVGKQWTTRYRVENPKGFTSFAEFNYQIVSREPVTVAAGTFNAYLVEGTGTSTVPKGLHDIRLKTWWDPARVRRPVAREEVRTLIVERKRSRQRARRREPTEPDTKSHALLAERQELISFKQG